MNKTFVCHGQRDEGQPLCPQVSIRVEDLIRNQLTLNTLTPASKSSFVPVIMLLPATVMTGLLECCTNTVLCTRGRISSLSAHLSNRVYIHSWINRALFSTKVGSWFLREHSIRFYEGRNLPQGTISFSKNCIILKKIQYGKKCSLHFVNITFFSTYTPLLHWLPW